MHPNTNTDALVPFYIGYYFKTFQVNDEIYQIRCYCSAAMHKNRLYQVKLEHNGFNITKATCECPAGKGNSAACKHIGALLNALQDFSKNGKQNSILYKELTDSMRFD